TIPAGDASYTLEVFAVDPAAGGEIIVSLSPLGAAPEADTATSTPIPTESAADVCQVTSPGNNINVRSGPGTNYNVIASLAFGESFPVLGENNGWYAIQLPDGSTGWVAMSVVQTTGDCSNVGFYEFTGETAPPPQTTEEADQGGQTGQATATYTPSYTPTTGSQPPQQATATSVPQQPTATYTSTSVPAQPTATYTPSYTPTTPPAAQVAPSDSNYAFVMELDTTSSLTDFVSYPDGDTEDRVSYRVTGLNPNVAFSGGRAQLTISISCFGNNTEQIEVFADGRTYGCGDTVVDRIVNADSNSGGVRVTAIGGDGTYVQWVLTGTVTRLN
ncbi:MAG: SH3 domain-containing protein, partial [Anaerolineae bacterium]|nr:SH3 domain-containing protein [Anaerolineae bacterium]